MTRIDRLARRTFDLLAIVRRIVDAKTQLRSLAEPWADTATSTGRLMIAGLGGLADVECDLIRARSGWPQAGEGAQREVGCRPKLTPHQQTEARRRRDSRKETLADIARGYNVSPGTISRLCL